MLPNACLLAKIGFDTAEYEPAKVLLKKLQNFANLGGGIADGRGRRPARTLLPGALLLHRDADRLGWRQIHLS